MSKILFTSDLHFGHEKVAGYRGFGSAEEHDDAIAERWRETVSPRDTVWILGDLAMSSPRAALELLAELPGQKHLIAGNHVTMPHARPIASMAPRLPARTTLPNASAMWSDTPTGRRAAASPPMARAATHAKPASTPSDASPTSTGSV